MSFFRKIPKPVLALVILLGFGLLRSPCEDSLRSKLIEARLLLPLPGHTAMQQMSQSALMGTLGGLRSLVATFLTLEAFEHWSNKEWDELNRTYAIITNLEPRDETHWVSVVWHIGINATASVQNNDDLPPFERERLFNQYALEAVRLGEAGLKQLPGSVLIRKQLGEVYREKLRDYCAAARVYKEMLGLPGCPPYAARFHGYFLAKCPGHEQEAYDYLMKLYRQSEDNHTQGLYKSIRDLEKALNIPPLQRIRFKARKNPARPQKNGKKKLPGGIILP